MIFTKFLCMLPVSMAQSSGMLMIGCIAYRREGGDGSAQRGRSVIYDCLVCIAMNVCRSLKTVLSAWLETYPNDFREPPEYSTLNSLVQFAICNAYDNELAQKARDQLSAFRERDSSEHIASGLGMCSLSQLITAELC